MEDGTTGVGLAKLKHTRLIQLKTEKAPPAGSTMAKGEKGHGFSSLDCTVSRRTHDPLSPFRTSQAIALRATPPPPRATSSSLRPILIAAAMNLAYVLFLHV
jgi:hypothetical protein